MKLQLSSRPKSQIFDLSAGQVFLHRGEAYVMTPLAHLRDGEVVNSVKLSTGTLYNFGSEIEVELLSGTFVEDELTSNLAEDL